MKQFEQINNLQDLNDFCLILGRSIVIPKNISLQFCIERKQQLKKELKCENGIKDYYITSSGLIIKIIKNYEKAICISNMARRK